MISRQKRLKTTFTKLKDETGQDINAQETFKGAIEESIKTINKGLIFEVDSSTTTSTDQAGSTTANKMTRQLGATIKLKVMTISNRVLMTTPEQFPSK